MSPSEIRKEERKAGAKTANREKKKRGKGGGFAGNGKARGIKVKRW